MVQPDSFIILQNLVNHIHPLPAKEWALFSGAWQPYTASRRELITASGTTEKYLYFVLEGVQRVYYFDEAEREATIVFSYPPSFGGVLDSFLLQKPSAYSFEALTPSTFLRAPFAAIDSLMQEYHSINTLIRKGVCGILPGLLERLVELQCFSSEEKFRRLLKRSPHILQWVPHKYLANYLGINPTNFSKLMNKVRIT